MATTPKAAKATKPYKALTPVEHDGELYTPDNPDKLLELTEEQAKPLLDVKAVAPAAAA